jgi:hypothetical protein
MFSYYHQYEEQSLLRQMNSTKQQNSFYNSNQEKECLILSTNKTISRKISYSHDDFSSFYYAMNIPIKKRRTSPPSPQTFEDSSFLPLPNICSAILASKL